MEWHRIHYEFGEASDTIDVWGETPYTYETYQTILRANRWLDSRTPIEITRLGKGDGTLALDHDPRAEEPPAMTHATIRAIKNPGIPTDL